MAGRMVTVLWRRTCLAAAPLGILLLGVSACSSFDPVKETRFTLLHAGDNEDLQISGARWVAYDDQHSLTSTCTNGAAGNHEPEECSLLYEPAIKKDVRKCWKAAAGLKGDLEQDDFGASGSICVKGLLRPLLSCVRGSEHRCTDTTNGDDNFDQSNMWGAGFGLAFSASGKEPWDADAHGVSGVAFDLTGIDQTKVGGIELNLRVEIPIELDPDTTVIPSPPVMRSDGSVIGSDGFVHRYDCDSGELTQTPVGLNQRTDRLRDLLATTGEDASAESPAIGTSGLHPSGSPFWQRSSDTWGPSPARVGHNEFSWDNVLSPRAPAITSTKRRS